MNYFQSIEKIVLRDWKGGFIVGAYERNNYRQSPSSDISPVGHFPCAYVLERGHGTFQSTARGSAESQHVFQ